MSREAKIIIFGLILLFSFYLKWCDRKDGDSKTLSKTESYNTLPNRMAATDQQMAATARELHAVLVLAEATEKAAKKPAAEAKALWCRCNEDGPCCRECDPDHYFY